MKRKLSSTVFTLKTAKQMIQRIENAWNSKDFTKVYNFFASNSEWYNGPKFICGGPSVQTFLKSKGEKELERKLKLEYWAHTDHSIAVRFEYEYHTIDGQWHRAYGNETWEFSDDGLIEKLFVRIVVTPICKSKRELC
ncbi:DUF1348 family protein [Zobellia alginiliquefaciens]|uniref:DUF1348 family protein n=1 Tax=Zobellia alginiliquefaciens TaxID=3032586 RepID=UPI0023E42E54|nr:DUF1348 family protein [Zobellia alginiliquefaciens]